MKKFQEFVKDLLYEILRQNKGVPNTKEIEKMDQRAFHLSKEFEKQIEIIANKNVKELQSRIDAAFKGLESEIEALKRIHGVAGPNPRRAKQDQ